MQVRILLSTSMLQQEGLQNLLIGYQSDRAKVPSDSPCKICCSDQSDPREIGVSGGLAQGDVGSVDSPKVASRSAASELGRLLESPEIIGLIEALEGTRWTGRPGYPLRSMVGMALAKSLYALPTWTRTVALVQEHTALATVIAPDGDVPSVYACYRFTAKLRDNATMLEDCIAAVIRGLKKVNPLLGWDVAIDASDMPAYANGKSHTRKGGRSVAQTSTATPTPPGATARGSVPAAAGASTATSSTWLCAPRQSFRWRGASRRHARTKRRRLLPCWTSCTRWESTQRRPLSTRATTTPSATSSALCAKSLL